MKCKLLPSCLLFAWPLLAGAASEYYVNDSLVNCPPQIPPQVDATNFVNNNLFSINFTNFLGNPPLYKTANTLNFTNVGSMYANYGFQFDTGPSGSGQRKMAANFHNSGTITAGSISNASTFFNFFFNGFLLQSTLPKLLISATNVNLNSSTNGVGINGLLSVAGKNVNLERANLITEGMNDSGIPATLSNVFFFSFVNAGVFDSYWGIGTNIMNPFIRFEIPPPDTPIHQVTSLAGNFGQILSLPAAVPYVRTATLGTNLFRQVVFLSDTNAGILNNVYFPFIGETVIEWLAPQTNTATGQIYTNYLYLVDDFGAFGANTLVQNTLTLSAQPTFFPINYQFFRGGPFNFGAAAAPGSDAGLFYNATFTNQFSAYGAVFAPTTRIPFTTPGSVITNLPGRTEIIADGELNLNFANINALNYLRLQATNHFSGSAGAQVISPYSDIALRTTNGTLAITNLLSPTVPRYNGEVDLWSGRWTNAAGTIYHVLFVDSRLASSAPAVIQDLSLRSTNVAGGSSQLVISDTLNVSRSLTLEAERITITTNGVGATSRSGEVNLLSTSITWPGSTPRLQYLTNYGTIRSSNSVFFGGSRTAPHFTSNYNEPYIAFVNRGNITTEGNLIWARHFENSGQFSTGLGFGSVALQSTNALLSNGIFYAINGDISVTTGNLTVTNHIMQAGRAITLSATNLLTDLISNAPSVNPFTNANNWTAGRGVSLPVKPASGDLLGTVILDKAAAGIDVPHLWAAQDRGGTNSAGYLNNAAIGKLILDAGSLGSRFSFTGAGTSNAIYVDYLELRNYATNIDTSGNLNLVNINTNIIIYYAQAVAGNFSVAERINHANGDRLRWVFNHAGNFSATNVVYPDGSTNFFNAALVQSQDIDSDGDGLVNAIDPTPILRAEDLALAVAIIAQPALGAEVSWNTVPSSANTVYYKPASGGGNWQVLTNLTVGPATTGRVKIFDPVTASGGRYYRVMMSPPQP